MMIIIAQVTRKESPHSRHTLSKNHHTPGTPGTKRYPGLRVSGMISEKFLPPRKDNAFCTVQRLRAHE
eukprot:1142852-Pelagomonas_calceolata.AAC.7